MAKKLPIVRDQNSIDGLRMSRNHSIHASNRSSCSFKIRADLCKLVSRNLIPSQSVNAARLSQKSSKVFAISGLNFLFTGHASHSRIGADRSTGKQPAPREALKSTYEGHRSRRKEQPAVAAGSDSRERNQERADTSLLALAPVRRSRGAALHSLPPYKQGRHHQVRHG